MHEADNAIVARDCERLEQLLKAGETISEGTMDAFFKMHRQKFMDCDIEAIRASVRSYEESQEEQEKPYSAYDANRSTSGPLDDYAMRKNLRRNLEKHDHKKNVDLIKSFDTDIAILNCIVDNYYNYKELFELVSLFSVLRYPDIVKKLIDKGADVQGTMLYHAAVYSDESALHILNAGADVNSANSYDKSTVLYPASLHNRSRLLHALLDKGANPNIYNISYPLNTYLFYATDIDEEIVRKFINNGASPYIKDNLQADALKIIDLKCKKGKITIEKYNAIRKILKQVKKSYLGGLVKF